MPAWVWIALVLIAVPFGFLFLIRVRYRLDWDLGSRWSAQFDFGVPGFMRGFTFPAERPIGSASDSSEKTQEASPSKPSATPESTKAQKSRGKFRSRMGWILLKDTILLRALLAYGLRFTRRIFGLLNLELECSVSHSDPARLGRLAGYWYAVQPFLGRRIRLQFRFQDQTPSLRLHLHGGFSAMRAVSHFVALIVSFPWILLARRFLRARRLAKLPVG